MRLIRYEVIAPGGSRTGLISSTSFMRGPQFIDIDDAGKYLEKLRKPLQKLKAPNLSIDCEFRFFFTNKGEKRFGECVKAIAKQAKIEGWTPIKQTVIIKDRYLPKEAYRDSDQIAWYLRDLNNTPKTISERIL